MTTPPAAPPTARTIRLMHGAMITGILLFAIVSHFVMRPSMAAVEELPAGMVTALLGAALLACVVSLALLRRVPRRRTDDSADLFWTTAATPALITWAVIEGACLLSVFLYGRTGSQAAIGVAAVGVALFIVLNPGRLEKRSR